MAKNYKLIKAKFLDFLANPNRTETQEVFAKKYGVNPATLSEWKRDKEFKIEFTQRLNNLLTDDLTCLYQIIKEKAFAGEINWARLYIQQINLLRNYKEEVQLEYEDDGRLVIVLDKEPTPILGGASQESSNNQ